MKYLATWTDRIIAGLALLLLITGGLWLKSCGENRQRAAQSKVDRGQSGAFRNSVEDTLNVVGEVNANEAAGAELSRQNEGEIRNAKGSDQRVDPGANAAGLRGLCRRASHRDDPVCRVQQPHTP